MIPRGFCRLYRVLLCAYPPDFRRRYGREMAQVFDDCCRGIAQTQGPRGLLRFGMRSLADWISSTVRERIASTSEAGAAIQACEGIPGFYTVASFSPRPGALIQGGLLSLVIFAAISLALGHSGSGSHRRLLVGSHHPSRSHLLPARTEAVPADLTAEIKANPYPDELPVNPYFRLLLVLGALDADRDNVISASEIANAPAALRRLDKNHDGKLTPEECGAPFGDTITFMRFHPVLVALDADHDGEISSSEIKHAPAALRTLDKNRDGKLTLEELLPPPRPR